MIEHVDQPRQVQIIRIASERSSKNELQLVIQYIHTGVVSVVALHELRATNGTIEIDEAIRSCKIPHPELDA